MKNFECPNCHQPTIGFWRRQIIGPTAPVECSNCGAEIAMNWSGYWPMIPFVAIWAISEFFEDRTIYWGLNIAGFIIWFWLSNQFVPLVVKSPPPAKPTP